MKRYQTLSDGEPKVLVGRGKVIVHKMSCCDCRLTHAIQLRILRGSKIELTAWRDNRATAVRRRGLR